MNGEGLLFLVVMVGVIGDVDDTGCGVVSRWRA